nr:MAG TPA_asm: hypothetical protein [Caudoviricetes sp.]
MKAIGLVVPGRKKGLSFNRYAMHFCVWFSGSIPFPASILNNCITNLKHYNYGKF